jgi:uncharacterized membrane protein
MKKYMTASAICLFPLLVFGVVNPLLTLYTPVGVTTKNENVILIFLVILGICISVVLTTMLALRGYASRIDSLEREDIIIYKKNRKLDAQIDKYTRLIADEESKWTDEDVIAFQKFINLRENASLYLTFVEYIELFKDSKNSIDNGKVG